jgi:hypothetical protein
MGKRHEKAPEAPKSGTDESGEVEKDPNAGQLAIGGAEPPPFVPIAVLRDRYLEAVNVEATAANARAIAEHVLAERVLANKNKPYPITGADGVERKYRSRCRKGADPKELGSLALSEIGASAPATGTEY